MKTGRQVLLAAMVMTLFAVLALGTVLAQDTVNIELVGWGADQTAVWDELHKTHPNIMVNFQSVNVPDLGALLKTRYLAGDPPDIVMIQPGAMVREFHENLLPLDDLIKNDPEIHLENFVQPVLETAKVDGVLYAIPQHPMVSGMVWYNADIFDKLDVKVPTNYNELLAVTKACRGGGYLPVAFNGLDAWNVLIVTEQLFAYIAPGKMQQAVAGEIPWTDPDLVKAMGWWQTLANDGVFQDGVFGAGYGDANAAFVKGNACMWFAGSWYKGGAIDGIRPPETVGNVLPMAFPDITNSGAAWHPAISAGHVFAISKQSKNIDAAWDVLKTIIVHGDALASYPVLRPVYADTPSVILEKATNSKQVDAIKAFELGAWKMDTFMDEWVYPEVSDAVAQAAIGVGTGQISAEDAMQEVQATAERVLKK